MSAGPYSIGSDVWPGLAKLAEECGEIVQVVGKIIALGANNPSNFYHHWDGSDVRERLEEELADTQAAIAFVIAHNELDDGAIAARTSRKLQLFNTWQIAAPSASTGENQ